MKAIEFITQLLEATKSHPLGVDAEIHLSVSLERDTKALVDPAMYVLKGGGPEDLLYVDLSPDGWDSNYTVDVLGMITQYMGSDEPRSEFVERLTEAHPRASDLLEEFCMDMNGQ